MYSDSDCNHILLTPGWIFLTCSMAIAKELDDIHNTIDAILDFQGLVQSCWPKSDAADLLATDVAKLKKRGIVAP